MKHGSCIMDHKRNLFWNSCILIVDVAWCCSRLARFVQQCCPWACALVRFTTCNMPQHVATCWPNARNMLRPTMLLYVACVWPELANVVPTMLGYVALRSCYRLAGLSSWANNTKCRNTSQHGGQTHATCCAQQCCDMLRWHVSIVWPGLKSSKRPVYTGELPRSSIDSIQFSSHLSCN